MSDDTLRFLIGQLTAQLGSPVILAGGAVRDMYHGKAPKDYDLFVLRDVSDQSYREVAEFDALVLDRIPGLSGIEVHTRYRDDSDVRIAYCIKFKFAGKDFDLLQYALPEATQSARAQCCYFDANINMMWTVGDGIIHTEPEALAVASGETPVTQLQHAYFRDGSSKGRLDYLASKYPQYAVDYETVLRPGVV